MKYIITEAQSNTLTDKIEKVMQAAGNDREHPYTAQELENPDYLTTVLDYHQAMVLRLFKPIPDEHMMLLHGVIGISGESGELLDAVKKHVFYEKPIDTENVIEELGDILFYVTAVANLMGIELTSLLAHNCCKLELNDNARYKSGTYSNAQATERADKQGCNVLPLVPSVHLDN